MSKKNLFSGLSVDILKKRKKTAQPPFIQPMLATLTKNYFSNKDWIFEQKFDGERCLAFKKNGVVTLLSRNKKSMNANYPELVAALTKQSADNFIVDGEIVALEKGVSDFQLLQGRMNLKDMSKIAHKQKAVPIYYCIFDIMYVDGYDVRDLPLLARKQVLKKLLTYNKILLFTEHRSTFGLKFFQQACKARWEGLIAKYIQSTYVPTRSRNWLKFKCAIGQELVIAGYTSPRGSRTDFGALLVGYYDKQKKLQFAGRVGTGFNQEVLKILGKKLRALQISSCPFAQYTDTTTDVHWVKPHLVAEFQFAEWTKGGKLRVPRYKGLRDDKKAKDVVREVAS